MKIGPIQLRKRLGRQNGEPSGRAASVKESGEL